MNQLALGSWTLVHREMLHFFRDRSRMIGVLIQPLLFWFFIGTGLNASFQPSNGESYMSYFFPGILLMVVMFTAIFSTFSLMEDRSEGFLQGVLASPTPRLAIVIGKVFGGALVGTIQGCLFLLLLLLPNLDLQLKPVGFLWLPFWLFIMGCILTTIGFIMAWVMKSKAGYHSLMSVMLLPMWIFSGAVFQYDEAPVWMRVAMQGNPLTHGLRLMRNTFEGHTLTMQQHGIACTVVVGVWIILTLWAVKLVKR